MANKHYLVYHIACMHHWQSVVADQLARLKTSVQADEVHIVINADDTQTGVQARSMCQSAFPLAKTYLGTTINDCEHPSMRLIEGLAGRGEGGTLTYVHTKGVSYVDDRNAKWRELMMQWVVDHNSEGVDACMAGYDCWGVNWMLYGAISHFSGNFWVASLNYLRTLKPYHDYKEQIANDHPERLAAEFWIGSGKRAKGAKSVGLSNHPNIWIQQNNLYWFHPNT